MRWWHLLPSGERNRILVCRSCGGHFDLSNNSKMASVLAGLIGMALAVFFAFQWIVKAGHGSKASIFAGVAVVALVMGLAAIAAARLTLKLEPKH
jgi:hypothetical protein